MIRSLIKLLNWSIGTGIVLVVLSNIWITNSSNNLIHESLDGLPKIDTAIVFGTTKSRVGGGTNPFFDNRMKAAAELYHSGKVKVIVLSGSKEDIYYNEPRDMQSALAVLGVEKSVMVLDTGGVRTLDTIIRAKENYGIDQAIYVTQKYHAHRVLYTSKAIGIEAFCYSAKFPETSGSTKALIREMLARTKAILDLLILN